MNELIQQDWYNGLIDDCKAIIGEAVFTSRWALVEGYWSLGKRIRTEENLERYKHTDKEQFFQDLGNLIGVSKSTLYYALQAYDKYPQLDTLPEGKNITWNKLITKYLPNGEREPILEDEPPFFIPQRGVKLRLCHTCFKKNQDYMEKEVKI